MPPLAPLADKAAVNQYDDSQVLFQQQEIDSSNL